jgi:signal transduction histidine kinase
MKDQARGFVSILEAAVHEHISARCRPAYFHDVRSGLQAIQSSIELMTRSAGSGPDNSVLSRKACEFAKRAVATHESTVARVLDDLIAQQHAAQALDLGALAREAVQFLQSMAGARDVSLRLDAPPDDVNGNPIIIARRRRLRMAILGLIWQATQTAAPGSQLRLTLERRDAEARLRFSGLGGAAPLPDGWSGLSDDVDLDDLIIPVAGRMVAEDGGRMSLVPDADGVACLAIVYPLAC